MGIITAPVGKKNGAGWKLMRTAKEEQRWFVLNADAHLQNGVENVVKFQDKNTLIATQLGVITKAKDVNTTNPESGVRKAVIITDLNGQKKGGPLSYGGMEEREKVIPTEYGLLLGLGRTRAYVPNAAVGKVKECGLLHRVFLGIMSSGNSEISQMRAIFILRGRTSPYGWRITINSRNVSTVSSTCVNYPVFIKGV